MLHKTIKHQQSGTQARFVLLGSREKRVWIPGVPGRLRRQKGDIGQCEFMRKTQDVFSRGAATVNENGPILFQKQARTVTLRGVNFQTGKATLTPEARVVLRDIAAQLVENPQYRVQISGHTDNTGSRAANLRLSIARARRVETSLEANGVPRRQVTSKGFGPAVPVASNTTAAGRAQNRRVELHRTN